MEITVVPATPDRWAHIELLFGPNGTSAGCWCMWNRQSAREFEEQRGNPNRDALKDLVEGDRVPGLLAYLDGEPAGWVSLAPREEFGRIQRSRVTKPVDETPVWSIVCFVIARRLRRQGIASALLDAAVDHAASRGAQAVEGYPVEPRRGEMPDFYAWMGLAEMFQKAGFVEIARRSETRPLFRKVLTSE